MKRTSNPVPFSRFSLEQRENGPSDWGRHDSPTPNPFGFVSLNGDPQGGLFPLGFPQRETRNKDAPSFSCPGYGFALIYKDLVVQSRPLTFRFCSFGPCLVEVLKG